MRCRDDSTKTIQATKDTQDPWTHVGSSATPGTLQPPPPAAPPRLPLRPRRAVSHRLSARQPSTESPGKEASKYDLHEPALDGGRDGHGRPWSCHGPGFHSPVSTNMTADGLKPHCLDPNRPSARIRSPALTLTRDGPRQPGNSEARKQASQVQARRLRRGGRRGGRQMACWQR